MVGRNETLIKALALLGLAIIALWFLFGDSSGSDPDFTLFSDASNLASGWAPKSFLCSYKNENDLAGFIWSHRGHDGQDAGSVDASSQTMDRFLQAGISNFDVDVVLRDKSHGSAQHCQSAATKDCFLVSHPVAYKSFVDGKQENNLAKVQTLDEFLVQIEMYMVGRGHLEGRHRAIISLEPKFLDPGLVRSMVAISQSTEYRRRHTAVISSSPEIHEMVERYMAEFTTKSTDGGLNTEGGTISTLLAEIGIEGGIRADAPLPHTNVGISVRTVPTSGGGTLFKWDHRPSWWVKDLVITEDVEVGASSTSTSEISDITFGRKCDDCCTITPRYSTSHAQVVFIDHKLMKRRGVGVGTAGTRGEGIDDFHSVCKRQGSSVVSWVVDDEDDMWAQLEAGVDGIITNRPVSMLQSLNARYQKDCQTL
jgi:hypothetical protein